MSDEKITGGLCWVRDREIENAGVHIINPDRGHVAEEYPHRLQFYTCKLCGCLFKVNMGDSDGAS